MLVGTMFICCLPFVGRSLAGVVIAASTASAGSYRSQQPIPTLAFTSAESSTTVCSSRTAPEVTDVRRQGFEDRFTDSKPCHDLGCDRVRCGVQPARN